MNRTAIAAILFLTVLLSPGCRKDLPVDEDFLAGNDIELKVGSTLIHRYDPLTWQLSFSRERLEYRVFNDNMSEYYTLVSSELPLEKDQRITGTLTWTTPRSSTTKKDLPFTVVKTDSQGTIWLWNGKEKIGISVRTIR
ncbi:MAG: hypothetical protein IJK96_02005 [Bacteroidales bacterium]|nr:hypothetical protein [Bacteroidales bacterium]